MRAEGLSMGKKDWINLSQSFTKQALSILSGNNDASNLYTQDGKTDGDNDNHSIAIA